ncbi:MAG: methyltransferase domain-containing protein [Sedimentisphaerales bacterium]|nr:methyltransferase domain-containing protein [Sedimentisphaerales bacterium]
MTNEIKDFFDEAAIDRNAKIAKNLIIEYEQIVRSQMVMSMVDPKPGEMILDGGCGNARDLIELSRRGCKCVGTDFSPNMVEEAKKELSKNNIEGIEVEVGDLTNLRFPDETFDKVFASEVLEHIPDYNKAISEMARVLKPGGCAVITTPNRHSLYGFDRYVILRGLLRRKPVHPCDEWKTHNELASALQDNGFQIVRSAGACYIPGSLIPYRLPDILKKLLIRIVRAVEPWLSRTLPKNAYVLAIKALKKQPLESSP